MSYFFLYIGNIQFTRSNLIEFSQYIKQLVELDTEFHEYEEKTTGRSWNIEQESLAYFPDEVSDKNTLGEKLAQNFWWLAVLAKHEDIDLEAEVKKFLAINDSDRR